MLHLQVSDTFVLPSRRSRRSRRTAYQGTRLPDWVWGLGLGVIVLLAVGGYFLITNVAGGGGGSTCDKALPALGISDTSAQAFIQEDADLGKVIDMLNRGDKNAAESAFYGPVHNFTHNVDPPVRLKNEQLAKDLCQAVLKIEDDLAFNASTQQASASLQRVRDLLRDAAGALGYPRPG